MLVSMGIDPECPDGVTPNPVLAIHWEVRSGFIYTLDQAAGALLNGTRVQKVNSEPGDGHQDGACGTVIGSVEAGQVPGFSDRYVYFVAWEDAPGAGVPVGIREGRLKALGGRSDGR